MSLEPARDLASFYEFLTQQLGQVPVPSPEEALDQWRAEHPIDTGQDAAAVREALCEMEAGDTGIALADFHREFTARRQAN